MAVYKVIQDIEAEDKLVGFLTLRTFIYAIIATGLAYVDFRLILASQLGPVRWSIILLFLFPILLFGILSLPIGREQPTEVWLLSRLRFFVKPRIRVWDQSGIQELVTITVPKKMERRLTKDITQTEVRSRLRALATTLDSRGWAVKNVAVNMNVNPGYLDLHEDSDSDRLVSANSVVQDQPAIDVDAADDIMDEQNNPTAQHFDALVQKADEDRKQSLREKIRTIKKEEDMDFEFLDRLPPSIDNEGNTKFVSHKIVSPASDDALPGDDFDSGNKDSPKELGGQEQAFLNKMHKTDEYVHEHAPRGPLKARSQNKGSQEAEKGVTPPVTEAGQTDKLEKLIQTAKDYPVTVSTLSQQANRNAQIRQIGPGEVEIDLQH